MFCGTTMDTGGYSIDKMSRCLSLKFYYFLSNRFKIIQLYIFNENKQNIYKDVIALNLTFVLVRIYKID